MLVYRICRAPFTDMLGEGPRLWGGRWNRPGLSAVYTATTRALAALEYLVHIDVNLVPDDLLLLTIQVPEMGGAQRITSAQLKRGWERKIPNQECQDIGDKWLERGRTLLLRVPAAPVPEEENVLLNPDHPDASSVIVVASRQFYFDPRLFE